jgi:nitrate reductase gamma subunit
LECARSTGCTEADIGTDLDGQLRHAKLEQNVAILGYIAGGSLIITGGVLLYLNRPRLMEPRSTKSASEHITVIPVISSEAVGVLVRVQQ